MTPGFHPNITAREYFAECCPAPALTNSTIKALLYRTAAEAAYEHPGITPDSPEVASTAEKRFGDVAHQIALGKGRGFAIGEFDAWASKEAKAFKAEAEFVGLTPVKRKEFDKAQTSARIMKGLIESTLAFLHHGKCPDYQTEVVFCWQEETHAGPIWCRGMMDVWAPSIGVILDPKFTDRMGDGVWERHASAMGWDQQDVWYRRGVEKIVPELSGRVRFINPLVSPKAPHVTRVRECEDATTATLVPLIEDAIEHFGACLHGNTWPGYPGGIEPWNAKSYTVHERAEQALEIEG